MTMAKRSVAAACAVGVGIGLCSALSPMVVLFGLTMVGLFVWAGNGVSGRERLWLFGLLGSGVVLRLLVLVAFFLFTRQVDGTFPVLVPDEVHHDYRARILRFAAMGIPIGQDYASIDDEYGWSALHYPHALLQLLVGEAPYSVRLFDVALYLTASVTLYRMVRPSFGALASLGGLAVVLFQPSLFVWSMAYLKEAPSQFLIALSLGVSVAATRTRSLRTQIVACGIVGAAVLASGGVRTGTDAILAGGIALGLLGAVLVRRPVLLPIALVVGILGGTAAWQDTALSQRAVDQLTRAAQSQIGYVHTAGWNYRVLDPEFYLRMDDGTPLPVDSNRFTPAATARYIVRAVATVFLVPLPWHVQSWPVLAYLAEQVVWIVLFVLGLAGVVTGLRRDPFVVLTLVGVIVVGAILIGMTSGNIGTLVRIRSTVMFLLPWLSGIGACEMLRWAVQRGGHHAAST